MKPFERLVLRALWILLWNKGELDRKKWRMLALGYVIDNTPTNSTQSYTEIREESEHHDFPF